MPKFDVIVADPPFSLRWEATETLGEDVRFKNHGIAPKSAADFAFVAHTAKAADATFWNVDYRLMPGVRMADVVADTVAACAAVDAERVVIVGHSAGGHLAVEAALRLPKPPAAVVAVSGLYDLDPLQYAFIQDELTLTDDEVAAFSPETRAAAEASA